MTQRGVIKIVSLEQMREGGGFLVRKVIGSSIPTCDPFLMLDHIGPVDYKPGEALGAPDHPHRGFETVSYIIDGGIKHQDSAGNKGLLKAGCVQWMTAGRGVVHSEMPTDDMLRNGGRMEGFQLWVNLPAKYKMIPPRYQDVPPDKIPVLQLEDGKVTVKVIAGESQGVHAVVDTKIPILFLDVCLQPGTMFTADIPESYAGFAYMWRGAGFLGKDLVPAHMGQVGELSAFGSAFQIKAEDSQACHVLLIAGEPIREPVFKYGPFVMNTESEIKQAIEDYRAGKLGSIEGKEERMRQTEEAQAQQKKNVSWIFATKQNRNGIDGFIV